ncbi:hypothetical protein Tco_1073905 [Tanacetum coccineum]
MHLVDPLLLDYVPGPEEPEQAPFLPDYPYAAADSPIALSPGYIDDSDPKKDPNDESKNGPTDYPADGGDDDDDSSGDDADDEDEDEAFEEDEDEVEEEEEHLAPADSTATTSPVVDLVPSAEKTEPFETDKSAVTPPPPLAYRTTARMSIRAQTPIPFPSKAEIPSLLFLVLSPPTTSPTCTEPPLGYKAARIRLRTTSPSPLPLSSPLPLPPPIILPRTRASMVLMRVVAPADAPEVVLPPRKTLCITPGPKFEAEESSYDAARSTRGFRADYGFVGTQDAEIRRNPDREVGYGITDILVDPAKAAEEMPPTTLAELSQRVTDFVTTIRHDTDKIYVRLDDAQSDRSLMTGQLNVLRRDRRYHANTTLLVERETRRQRIEDSDMLTWHIQHEHGRFREFQSTRDATPEDADSSSEIEYQRNNNLNGNGSQGSVSGIARPVRPTHECTYTDFLKCQPMNFKGTKVVVGLTQWFKRMETVFNISNCIVENQVKFAICTLYGVALTWWKSHVKTVGYDAAYGVP